MNRVIGTKCKLCKREKTRHRATDSACPLGRLRMHMSFNERGQVFVPDPTIDEIGDRIHAHLDRFEKDPKINVVRGGPGKPGEGTLNFYHVNAWGAGRYVGVRYVSYQGGSMLKKDEAAAYLAWLDAGNIGTHYDQQRSK